MCRLSADGDVLFSILQRWYSLKNLSRKIRILGDSNTAYVQQKFKECHLSIYAVNDVNGMSTILHTYREIVILCVQHQLKEYHLSIFSINDFLVLSQKIALFGDFNATYVQQKLKECHLSIYAVNDVNEMSTILRVCLEAGLKLYNALFRGQSLYSMV